DLIVTSGDGEVATGVARRDDGLELVWQTDGATVTGPPAYRGRPLGRGFRGWAGEALDPDRFELAVLLRRAIWMRRAADLDLDDFDVLAQSGVAPASCYASQPGRIDLATRNRGTSLPELPA